MPPHAAMRPVVWPSLVELHCPGHPELSDERAQLLRLLRQRVAGGRRFLHHRCVLLRRLIHLVDGGVDLSKAAPAPAHRSRCS